MDFELIDCVKIGWIIEQKKMVGLQYKDGRYLKKTRKGFIWASSTKIMNVILIFCGFKITSASREYFLYFFHSHNHTHDRYTINKINNDIVWQCNYVQNDSEVDLVLISQESSQSSR